MTTYEDLRTKATVLVVNVMDGDDKTQGGFYDGLSPKGSSSSGVRPTTAGPGTW